MENGRTSKQNLNTPRKGCAYIKPGKVENLQLGGWVNNEVKQKKAYEKCG